MNILQFKKMKQAAQKITMLTCYDHCFARLIADTNIDCILVGDSVAMVMHGFENTVYADMDMMIMHTRAVARAKPPQLIVADMPFLSYRIDLPTTMRNAQMLMQAGAHAIKIEGVAGNGDAIEYLVQSGIPVMGHLGLTPQAVHQLGGFKVQGREAGAAAQLLNQAKSLEALGCFAVVLECIPGSIAQSITQALNIPTIGIGAGPHTDGQVLVLNDLLGLDAKFKAKFVKQYLSGATLVQQAFNQYASEVKQNTFPDEEHSHSL